MKNLLTILCIFFTTPALCLTCDIFDDNYPIQSFPTALPDGCQTLLATYVDTKKPEYREPQKCNHKVISCTESQKTSECNPCAVYTEWNETFFDTVSQKYKRLCESNNSPSEDDLVDICSDVFGIDNQSSQQAIAPESIEAPVFNTAQSSTDETQNIKNMINNFPPEDKKEIESILDYVNQAETLLNEKCSKNENKNESLCKNKDQTIQELKKFAIDKINNLLQQYN